MPTPRPLQPDLTRPLRFPRDLLRILYWAYARPWTLERYLQQFDPDLRLYTGLWALGRRGKTHPPLRHLVSLALFHILITPWLAFPLAGLLHLVGMPVNWVGVLLGVLLGVLGGVLMGVLWGVLEGVAFGGGFIGGALLGALRLYEYPLWAGLSAGLALRDRRGRGFRLLSPLWHEVIPLPLPGVGRYLRALGRSDPAAARAAIAALSAYHYGWARRAAAHAAWSMFLDDLEAAQDLPALAARAGAFAWLPPDLAAQRQRLLAAVDDILGLARAAAESDTPYNRALRLEEARDALAGLRQGITLGADAASARLLPVLENWDEVLRTAHAQALRQEWIPNPYTPGSPLMARSPVFRGREPVFHMLEAELANYRQQRPALLLYGERRMGKTSTLKRFPVRLGPRVVPLIVDLQSAAATDTAQGFFSRLIADARAAARAHRRLEIPPPDASRLESDPYRAFLDWVDAARQAARGSTVFLLALDEYEKLEEAIRTGRLEVRVLDVLRHLLQHRQGWLLLFSGRYTFEALPVHWSDRFINMRALPVGPLAPAEAEDLIRRPIPEFPEKVRYAPEAVAMLREATGGHPNWLQAALHALIGRLNEERRREVTPEDARWAVEQVPQRQRGDFDYFWRHVAPEPFAAPDLARRQAYQRVLGWIAAEPGITAEELHRRLPQYHALVGRTLRFFRERAVLLESEGGYRWAIPLLAQELRRRAEEEGLLRMP